MRRVLLVAAVGFALLPVNGSAQSEQQVTYRRWGMTGGYKDKATGPNAWHVAAGVNGIAPEGSAGKIALYRAAELTDLAGYHYFQIINQKGGQTYMGAGWGPATIRGPAGMELDIVAVNDPAPPQTCLAKRPELCVTLNAQEMMVKIAPYLKFKKSR